MKVSFRPFSLLGVSGGADSMFLLHAYRNVEGIHVAHVNYHIRSDSDLDEKLVSDFCNKYSIPFHSISVYPEKDTGIEEWARDIRYSFFNELITTYDLKNIITAHNANDQAETVLMRLHRGTGIAGLAGIHKKSNLLFRPMLEFKKDYIYEQCKLLDIPYREDSTNTDTKYLRNWFRHEYVDESMLEPLCKIASTVQDMLPKLISMAEIEFQSSVKVNGNTILIEKTIDKDDLLFLYLSKIMSGRYALNEKTFNNIFSSHTSLNKFSTHAFTCDKRKKDWIIITFKECLCYTPSYTKTYSRFPMITFLRTALQVTLGWVQVLRFQCKKLLVSEVKS